MLASAIELRSVPDGVREGTASSRTACPFGTGWQVRAVRRSSSSIAGSATNTSDRPPHVPGRPHHACLDYRLPDGFSWSDATSILKVALASGRAVGMEVTIYNPALDEGGTAGRELTNVLVAALGTSNSGVTSAT